MTKYLRHHAGRRGALLLLVLTALTFFMMIGTLMLLIATRTRATARAFADATNGAASSGLQPNAVLDDALLLVLRGRRSPDENRLPTKTSGASGRTVSVIGQSLLEDKYGTAAISGTASPPAAVTVANIGIFAPVVSTNLTGLNPAPMHPCDLNGRLLTFKPDAGDGDPATYRILRTTGQGQAMTAYLANISSERAAVLPTKPCEVIINGREFCKNLLPGETDNSENNEAFDAFGAGANGRPADPWLAGTPLEHSKAVSTGTIQASFVGPTDIADLNRDANGDGLIDGCDNDNDGVADSWWISGLVPDRPSPSGGVLKHDLAFLVLDLDGRMNLNTAGSLTPVITGTADWPTSFVTSTGATVAIAGVPPGMGYGPADVGAGRLVATGTNPTGVPGFPGRWPQLCQTTTSAQPIQMTATSTQRRPTPVLGAGIEGRYGPSGTNGRWSPGRSDAVPDPQAIASLIGNSPTDLSARLKTFHNPTSSGVPTLYFYTPDFTKNDLEESPYQLRVDGDAPRSLRLRQSTLKAGTSAASSAPNRATDNVFSVAELERVLRQYDSDVSTLPTRLAVLLDDFTERSRMTVTTDSWDTPAMTGPAMIKVRDYMRRFTPPTSPLASLAASGAEVYDTLSPDVSAGLRFDLNRPLDHPTAFSGMSAVQADNTRRKIKERYCRHLYTLLVALGMPATRETAQWATNICDFRDPDSTMTRFRYDPDPTNGWSTTGLPSVFGAERPEVVITETLAWHDGTTGSLSVVLYHPWDAQIGYKEKASGTWKYAPTEILDPSLAADANAGVNTLDLGRKVGSDSIWRLRVDGGSTIDLASLAAPTAGGTASPLHLVANDYLCVQSDGGGGGLTAVTVSSFKPVASGGGRVVLERLADPTRAYSNDQGGEAYNPYVTVDEATLLTGTDATTAKKQQRDSATFWRQSWNDSNGALGAYPSKAPWFHWPNRPLVSIAELALVPAGDSNGMLQAGAGSTSPILDTSDAAKKLILDAVQVPSRFAGTSQPIGGQSLLQTVVASEEICTTFLPRWREPGRTNVNTIAKNINNTSQPLLDNAVWLALVGPAAATIGNGSNPFTSGGNDAAGVTTSADSFAKMLSLNGAGGTIVTETPSAPRDNNPFFTYATANRLGSVGTIRSNVFAIWITLRVIDTSASASSPTYRRMFAIIDRSIPVGFRKGENLNVRDTIRLQRFMD